MNHDVLIEIFNKLSYFDQLFYSRHFKFFKPISFKDYLNDYLKKYYWNPLDHIFRQKTFIVGDAIIDIMKGKGLKKILVYHFIEDNNIYYPLDEINLGIITDDGFPTSYDYIDFGYSYYGIKYEHMTCQSPIIKDKLFDYFYNEKIIYDGKKLYFNYNTLFFYEFDISKIKIEKTLNFNILYKIPKNKQLTFKQKIIKKENILKILYDHLHLIYELDDKRTIYDKVRKSYRKKSAFSYDVKKFFDQNVDFQKIAEKYDLESFYLNKKLILNYLENFYPSGKKMI